MINMDIKDSLVKRAYYALLQYDVLAYEIAGLQDEGFDTREAVDALLNHAESVESLVAELRRLGAL
jgi:hypothetical protein